MKLHRPAFHPEPVRPETPSGTISQLRVSVMGAEVRLGELAEFQTRLHLVPTLFSEPASGPLPRRH